MNTTEFLKRYKEIENLIRENLEEIRRAYEISEKYQYTHFFIERIDSVHIELFDACLNDYDYVCIALKWLESDETLKSYLADIVQRDWSKFERFRDNPKVEKFDVNTPKVEKFDVKTLQPFDKVLVRDNDYMEWSICWFSHMGHRVEEGLVKCDGMTWSQCLPYNEETKHLVGTNDDCPDYYKWWENYKWRKIKNDYGI